MKTEDLLHCEEQLRTTLHCDDKEKLRRKLAQLQREYLRTAQRLQRAERLDTVRRHVRNRITQQNQREPEEQPDPSLPIRNSSDSAALGASQSQQHTEDAEIPKRTNTIRFLLPSDPASPQPPDPDLVAQGGRGRGSALRLRSRRSRLRLEKRSVEAGRSADDDERGREPSGGVRGADGAGEREEKARPEEAEAVNESEECFSGAESESPSLLLTHWSSQGSRKNESVSASLQSRSEKTARGEPEREEEGAKQSENNSDEEAEQNKAEKAESHRNPNDTGIIQAEANNNTKDDKPESLLDSCTLVEGLLFPAEYYVRTTRRMTSSQSQPDVQAVILSQLGAGRRCGGRGRGRGPRKRTAERPDRGGAPRAETSDSPPNASEEISGGNSARSSSDVPEALAGRRPIRGRRKRRRGRGRGRGRPPAIRSSSSPSLSTEGSPPSRLSPEVSGTPTCSDPLEKVYPIFSKRSQESIGTSSWRPLLLPSPPLAPLPLPAPSPRLPVKALPVSSLHLDFHLPDEQFASLKLLKLRRIAAESGLERFSSPSGNTRGSRLPAFQPLPLSLTPTIANSTSPGEERAAPSSAELRNPPADPLPDAPINQTEGGVSETDDRRAEIRRTSVLSGEQDSCLRTNEDRTVALVSTPQTPAKCDGAADEETSEEDLNERHVAEDDRRSVNAQAAPEEPTQTPAALFSTPPVKLFRVESAEDPKQSPETVPLPFENKNSNVLRSPPPASAACPFASPHLPSPTPASSLVLPSLGQTPHPACGATAAAAPLLPSSPCPPSLTLPPPHSPSTQNLSPPALSPCLSTSLLRPSQDPDSPHSQIRFGEDSRCRGVEPATCPTPCGAQLQGSGEQTNLRVAAEETHVTHTLKAAAGGPLVDACCFTGSSGSLCVAAAGTWAVCLWSLTPASDWTLTHTWTFSEPVVNVFPVPDAAGLICVSLGQLEIREVRKLSCSSLTHTLLCEGVIQAVVGMSGSRVVTSSPSSTGSSLQAFALSDSSSVPSSRSLAPPAACVGTLAPVDHLSDALIGTDEGGRLFVWNVKSGQLLCRIALGEGLSHTACLRGFSHCGVLFVLLQHHFLSSPEEEVESEAFKEGRMRRSSALFSLVAVNPLSRKSVLATRLYPPAAWSGRLCEADVHRTRLVGLSQSGCVCVWELGRGGPQQVLRAPGSEGWQLARWGAADTLVTGHPNGDVTLHCWKSLCD